ncbi:MAG: hypothetical protein EB028_07525 [Actinobacteria bacterium]|nr:hypothetical protein [Actinomycetota bacterium]
MLILVVVEMLVQLQFVLDQILVVIVELEELLYLVNFVLQILLFEFLLLHHQIHHQQQLVLVVDLTFVVFVYQIQLKLYQ